MLKEAFTLLALVCCAAAEYTVTVNAKSSVSQRLLRKRFLSVLSVLSVNITLFTNRPSLFFFRWPFAIL